MMAEPAGFGDGTVLPFVDSIWTATSPIRFVGTWFPHVMTIIRLASGNLLLHSPCRPSPGLIDSIARLGTVTDVVAPNWFHDLYLHDYRAVYPDATFWAPTLLRRQQPSLVDRDLGDVDKPSWFEELPYISLAGLLSFDESLFLHGRTRTLIVADALTDASAPAEAPFMTRLGYQFLGLNGELKIFPILRWFGWSSNASLRRAARQISAWSPEHVIVGHGKPIKTGAAEQLRTALSGLRPASPRA